MGLDMRPIGKPKAGFEERFQEIFEIVKGRKEQSLSVWDKLKGKRIKSKDELLEEWFDIIQTSTYETLKAPQVGKDEIAEKWLKERYENSKKEVSFENFRNEHIGFYVLDLSEFQDGVPVYCNPMMDENVFRGEFLTDCTSVIGSKLVEEAWQDKFADETLDYGKRLMAKADEYAKKHNLEFIKKEVSPPEQTDSSDTNDKAGKLHIVYALAKWLIFYGENGHGYEADY